MRMMDSINTQTQGALTFKNFMELTSENNKLTSLNGEMKTMSNDFTEMVKKRAEAKARLEAKFVAVDE